MKTDNCLHRRLLFIERLTEGKIEKKTQRKNTKMGDSNQIEDV